MRNWLVDAGYAIEKFGRIIGQGMPGEAFVHVSHDLEFPVTPLTERTTAQQSSNATFASNDYRTYSVDLVQTERANSAHNELVDMMANKIRVLGASPRSNMFVDMATELDDLKYLFEMKSARPSSFHRQIRQAISQLYEYAFIQRVPDAILCVVIEIPPPKQKSWLKSINHYLKISSSECWPYRFQRNYRD